MANVHEQGFLNPEIDRPKLGALIVLGHNIGAGWNGEKIRQNPDHLSGHSKLNVLATAILFREGIIDKIIFSSGYTAGKQTLSEAEAMRNFLRKRFPEIPESAVILEDRSIDAAGNAEESIKIVNQKNFTNVGILSTGDHLRNALILFERHGLEIKEENSLVSEEVVADNMIYNFPGNPESFLKAYNNSSQVEKDRWKEMIRSILLSTIDKKGLLLRKITSRTRK
jgi:uncharacterized SAM-binding protein YcdF (DUF218 family)